MHQRSFIYRIHRRKTTKERERRQKRERGSCRCEGKHTGEEKPKQSGKIAK